LFIYDTLQLTNLHQILTLALGEAGVTCIRVLLFVLFPLNCRRSKGTGELEMKVGLDQYAVPATIRTAVNHAVDSASAVSSAVSEDAARIRFLTILTM